MICVDGKVEGSLLWAAGSQPRLLASKNHLEGPPCPGQRSQKFGFMGGPG